MYEFFLSYARDTDEVWASRFHHDLCLRVAMRTGRTPDAVGVKFTGRAEAPDTLLEQCRKVVALVSPEYLRRASCRRELEHFRTRNESDPPVLWITWEPIEFPDAVPEADGTPPAGEAMTDGFTTVHPKKGLLYLLRRRSLYGEEYEDVVEEAANRLLMDPPGALLSPPRLPSLPRGLDRGKPDPGSPVVDIAILAPSRPGVPPTGDDNAPHRPTDPPDRRPRPPGRSVRDTVTDILATAGALGTVLPGTAVTPAWIREHSVERPLLLVVDARAVVSGEYRELLLAADGMPPDTVLVLAPDIEPDGGTGTPDIIPEGVVRSALPRLWGAADHDTENWNPRGPGRLERCLHNMLTVQRNRLITHSRPARIPAMTTGGFDRLPLLGGDF
ncbi:toll/interleukin-1 receptor domain-containing protein [Streptomyces calidiresistens]|uniref:TIR domain-containing protein n=1 Tax=Streptomyces calidiresistens TaxID=1485586 RepID=A0A7W3XY02_9ACTN|nr:toll/interleukin-1 receptor domain-containing protein [Streptomyces calidiresistens]MBB0231504.1 TIR domain-containing protein [Streptomyces calidiresistens]